MFDKFGEFDSFEEINRAAKAQLEEGDLEAIKVIAEENGLDVEDVEDFCTGALEILATPVMAACGKLDIEGKELQVEGLLGDWKNYIMQMCTEDVELSICIRKKGKYLSECLGEILKYAFTQKKQITDKIVRAAGLNPPIYLGIPGKAEAKRIIKKYYMGE